MVNLTDILYSFFEAVQSCFHMFCVCASAWSNEIHCPLKNMIDSNCQRYKQYILEPPINKLATKCFHLTDWPSWFSRLEIWRHPSCHSSFCFQIKPKLVKFFNMETFKCVYVWLNDEVWANNHSLFIKLSCCQPVTTT